MATLTLCESSGNGFLLKPVEMNREGAHTRTFTQSEGEPLGLSGENGAG